MPKQITSAEYGSPLKVRDYEADLKYLVDREAEIWHAFDPRPEPPKYQKVEITRNKPGWYALFSAIGASLKTIRI